MVHDLKTWSMDFETILDESKTFEVTRIDPGYDVADVLRFREWDPETEIYTSRVIHHEISHVLKKNERR